MKTASGFSLMEIVVAITIMAIAAIGIVPAYNRYIKRAKKTTTVNTIKTLEGAIDQFKADTGSYPESLVDLTETPSNEKQARNWEGPYLKKLITTDGYKEELVYEATKGGKHAYELYSYGENGEGSPEEEWISVWDL